MKFLTKFTNFEEHVYDYSFGIKKIVRRTGWKWFEMVFSILVAEILTIWQIFSFFMPKIEKNILWPDLFVKF
jgi:hypothetical protein